MIALLEVELFEWLGYLFFINNICSVLIFAVEIVNSNARKDQIFQKNRMELIIYVPNRK